MYRQLFYLLTPLSLALIAVLSIFWLPALWLLIIWLPLALIGLHDLLGHELRLTFRQRR